MYSTSVPKTSAALRGIPISCLLGINENCCVKPARDCVLHLSDWTGCKFNLISRDIQHFQVNFPKLYSVFRCGKMFGRRRNSRVDRAEKLRQQRMNSGVVHEKNKSQDSQDEYALECGTFGIALFAVFVVAMGCCAAIAIFNLHHPDCMKNLGLDPESLKNNLGRNLLRRR